MDDDAQRGELHFPAFDLFAQVFRRAPDHQAADEHCQNGVQDHIHQTDALAAEYYVQHHVQQRDHAAQRRQGVVHIVHRTGGKRGRDGGEHRRLRNAEADLLALHTAHGLVQADIRQRRVALALGPEAYAQADDEQDAHGGKNAASLAAVDGRGKAAARTQAACPLHAVRRFLPAGVHHFTEGDDACAGQEHHGIQLDQV